MRLEARSVSIQTLGLVKMEDRKRAAVPDLDDSAPPAKRQATLVNGAKPSSEVDRDPEWLEVRQPFPLGHASVVCKKKSSANVVPFAALSERCARTADEGIQTGEDRTRRARD